MSSPYVAMSNKEINKKVLLLLECCAGPLTYRYVCGQNKNNTQLEDIALCFCRVSYKTKSLKNMIVLLF